MKNKMLTHQLGKISLVVLAVLVPSYFSFAANTSNFTAAPPFIDGGATKPNVVIALDNSGSMRATTYKDPNDPEPWHRSIYVHEDFDPASEYYGYFDSSSKYIFDTDPAKRFFYAHSSGTWDGNFLNWLTMKRMDIARKVLTGGKVRNRAGETIGGDTWWILEGHNEKVDPDIFKRYSSSSAVSAFVDSSNISVSQGFLNTETGVPLSANVEVGRLALKRDAATEWVPVRFTNTYTDPVVVASGISMKDDEPAHPRVRNVTATGFEIRIEEWDYQDDVHDTEMLTYIVAEKNETTGGNKIKIDGTDRKVWAGVITTNTTMYSGSFNTVTKNLAFGTTPVVFAGVSTFNSTRPVVGRVTDISSSNFRVFLQNEETYSDIPSQHPASEEIHWIAFEKDRGISDYTGLGIEIDCCKDVDDTIDGGAWQGWKSGGSFFETTPTLAVGMQDIDNDSDGRDPEYFRYDTVNIAGFNAKFDEDKSRDSETGGGNDKLGWLAVERPTQGFEIRIGVKEEPRGVLQNNSGSLRFGLTVYNFDHTLNPDDEIYSVHWSATGEHGGTFRPCYPDINLPRGSRSNFDICYDTHVKAPLDNILHVIEDYPLINGQTQMGETLYDIWGYFQQKDFNRNGHNQYYDNGTEGIGGTGPDGDPKDRNSYEISNDWDPYYYDEIGGTLPCATSFILNFNDGEPFKDFDSSAPSITNDGVGLFAENEKVDDLSLMMRKVDCRSDISGFQEITSYFVYAALGQDQDNNNNSRVAREAAANGGFVDADEDRAPDVMHPTDFVQYVDDGKCISNGYSAGCAEASNFTSDSIADGTCTANEWDNNGDCEPDTFFFAFDGLRLEEQLNAAFSSIAFRGGTGGAASVIASSRSGEGSLVNAVFRPTIANGDEEVAWVGDVHALFIDDAGNMRWDDGDKTLEDSTSDNYLDMCSNEDEDIVRVKRSADLASRPSAAQTAACSEAVFSIDLFDIEYLWSGSDWLASLSDAQVTAQRSYTSNAGGRHIISGIDTNGDGIVQNSEQVDFLASSFPEAYAGLLADDLSTAQDVITFVRGEDVSGMRSRQLDGRTLRLGDVIYSTPTIVGKPAENLDLLYESASYRNYFDKYKDRRQVIYAGSNGGMVHAFNGGWYDSSNKQFKNAHGTAHGSVTNYSLGAELWAYVPYNGLRHLEYLTNPGYGAVSSDHVYFMDLKPRLFDAKIFSDDADHPDGWGTVLVIGMRLGGGAVSVDADLSGTTDNRTLTSSYAIFDVSNPDKAPELLLEYTHPDLGFTTSIPAPITVGTDSEGNGEWYLMLGSGADTDASGFDDVASTQNGRLFLLDLKAVASGSSTVLETAFGINGIYTLADANSFVSDITPVDFGLDNYTTDAVYFGTVSGTSANWGGKLYRMKIQSATNATPDAVSAWSPLAIHDAGSPITAGVALANDSALNRWLFVGTGRYFTTEDNTDNSVHHYYGLKEPRNTDGDFTYGTVVSGSIVDISSVEVQAADAELSPVPALSPALPANATVGDLEARMRQYSDGTSYLSGWRRTFAPGERNFGAAALLGGLLSYTTFDPILDECTLTGDAYLYALNALTGTAGEEAILSQDPADVNNAYIVDLGSSPATSPSLHRGDGYVSSGGTTIITQSSDGSIMGSDSDTPDGGSGEKSWRQLR